MNPDRSSRGTSRPRAPRRSSTGTSLPWGKILLVLLVLGGVTAYFGARPAWRRVKAFRAHRFVAEAAEHFRAENWSAGFERTRAATQLAPTDITVVRHAAYAHSRIGSEAAFHYFDTLLGSPQVTDADREEYASLALRIGNVELARQQLDELLEAASPSARTLVLGSQLSLARRDFANGLRLARQAASKEPSNPTNHFAVASILALSRRDADLTEAREILWPHARKEGPLQPRALAGLLGIRDTSRADREEVERILAAKTTRTTEEDFILADARISLDPSSREKTADGIVEKYGRGTPEQLGFTGAWLNRNQLYHRTRDLILADAAGKDPRLFTIRFEALTGLSDLRGAYDFIMMDKPPGDPAGVEFLRCSTALKLKDQTAVDAHYRNLLAMGRKNIRALRTLADFATRNGNRAVANEVFQILARNPRDAAIALRGLIRNADSQGETWTARDYARRLAALRKEDDSVKLQIAYYDLLLKENLDEAQATAMALHQARPEDFGRRAVLALAHLRHRENLKALGLIAGQTPDLTKIPTGIRAVLVATYGAAGRAEGVTNVLQRLAIHRLKPEERELIKPYITGSIPQELEETDVGEVR